MHSIMTILLDARIAFAVRVLYYAGVLLAIAVLRMRDVFAAPGFIYQGF